MIQIFPQHDVSWCLGSKQIKWPMTFQLSSTWQTDGKSKWSLSDLCLFCSQAKHYMKTSTLLWCSDFLLYQCQILNVTASILWIRLLWKPSMRLCICSTFHFTNAMGMVCTCVFFGQWYLGHITANESWHWSDTAKGDCRVEFIHWIFTLAPIPCFLAWFLSPLH